MLMKVDSFAKSNSLMPEELSAVIGSNSSAGVNGLDRMPEKP